MMKHIAVLSNGHEIKVADIASYNDINIGDKVYLEWDAKDAVMIKNPTGPIAENFDTLRGGAVNDNITQQVQFHGTCIYSPTNFGTSAAGGTSTFICWSNEFYGTWRIRRHYQKVYS